MAIWMDMTNCLVNWNRGMVGLVRAELLLAKHMHELDQKLRFSVCTGNSFREVPSKELLWLFEASNEGKAYGEYQARKKRMEISSAGTGHALPSCLEKLVEKLELRRHARRWARSIHKRLVRFHLVSSEEVISEKFTYPYASGDVIFSCGWYDTAKEELFTLLKEKVDNIKIGYLIYDLVILQDEVRPIYAPADVFFEKYLRWINNNCDFILYGGKTAQHDAESFFKSNNLDIINGDYIKFGSEINTQSSCIDIKSILSKYNIRYPYVITVGSIDARKNYKVLYQAYCMLALEGYKNIPDLVIIGQQFSDNDLISQIKENPLTKEKIHIISVSDEELNVLYQNCEFTMLPSLYEGWSVVLPEMLMHRKLCLCSDVAPLREVGGEYAIFLNPRHPREWADAIKYYTEHKDEVIAWESRLQKEWHPITWKDSAYDVYHKICKFSKEKIHSTTFNILSYKPTIYCDITLLFYSGNFSGIPRAQMLFTRYLSRINSNIKYFTLHSGHYIEINKKYLKNIISDKPIDIALKEDNKSLSVINFYEKDNFPFRNGDVVFSSGAGYDLAVYNNLLKSHKKSNFKFIQLIYDFTPIIVPQTHTKETIDFYYNFLYNTYQLSDYIMYGGATAQHDGMEYQRSVLKQEPTPSFVIKFGSDIQSHSTTRKEEDEILKSIGIKGDFLLTVGTIEARKNHELLYEAYLELMRGTDDVDALPQLVICGRPGWKTEDFRQRLSVDSRIFGRIIMFSPSDEELDVLYKRCKFTLLASQYEGWSLTLPESFNYGKFCLSADVAPLREVGQDIIEYANPYDPEEWAKKIRYYMLHPEALAEREKKIAKEWVNTTWKESAAYLNHTLVDILNAKGGADHDA